MYKFLDYLEDDQKSCVLEDDIAVSAGAGAGKTRSLIYKIIHLIESRKIAPEKILVIAPDLFSIRCLKEEMELFLASSLSRIKFSTISALAIDFYRFLSGKKGTVYGYADLCENSELLLKLNEKKREEFLSNWLNFYQSGGDISKDEEFQKIRQEFEEKLSKLSISVPEKLIYDAYHSEKKKLDDFFLEKEFLILDGLELLTPAEYELFKTIADGKKIWVTTDGEYCITAGSRLSTARKDISITEARKGERLKCAAGFGKISEGRVEEIEKKNYQGLVIRISTKGGREVVVTPNHLMFARMSEGEGYRVALVRDKNGSWLSLLEHDFERNHSKKKEAIVRIWILRTFRDSSKALYYQQYLSCLYGIPFFSTVQRLKSSEVLKFKEALELDQKVERLKRDFFLYDSYPHYALQGPDGKHLKMIFFGGEFKERWHQHLLKLNADPKIFDRDLKPIKSKGENWYVQTEKKKFEDALKFGATLSSIETLETLKLIKATDGAPFQFMPASHVQSGMWIPVVCGDRIKEDTVASVDWMEYNGEVFDLNLPDYRNFVVEGIVVHNSSPAGFKGQFNSLNALIKDFPNLKTRKLTRNYRNNPQILSFANEFREEKMISSQTEESEPQSRIVLYNAHDEHGEVNYIIDKIQAIIFKEGRAYADFGILYRLPRQADVFAEQFNKKGIPHRIISSENYYIYKEIKDLISYLRVIFNTEDDLSLKRIINVPRRGIGERTIDLIEENMKKTGSSFYDSLKAVLQLKEFPLRFVKQVEGFRDLIEELIVDSGKFSPTEFVDVMIKKSDVISEISKVNSNKSFDAISNVKLFPEKMRAFFEGHADRSLIDFLDYLVIQNPLDDYCEENAILLTDYSIVHQLNFPVLFLPGLEDGITPYRLSQESKREMDLFLRALACGRERIFLSYASYRRLPGEQSSGKLTPFLSKCLGKIFTEEKEEQSADTRKAVADAGKKNIKAGVQIGDMVSHRMWGRGVITQIDGSGEEAMLTIEFENEGQKKLMMKYAPLQKM
ncbi:MAG: 3'-5' exonuclease [Candidatus Wallbacteria bacterium]|nr:3'-5' exonuclease [Candidatus Wallbacteria bacterium]